jgi:hypothetical protein
MVKGHCGVKGDCEEQKLRAEILNLVLPDVFTGTHCFFENGWRRVDKRGLERAFETRLTFESRLRNINLPGHKSVTS